ncbi:MAG TPA: hypothetical protein VKN18_12505 [Blastocatellia bacterium]|nr:hypothetical protein [Blastocatellia bacterium]
MRKQTKVILSLSVSCLLVIGLTWLSKSSSVQSQSKSKPEADGQNGIERINAKARSVKGPDKKSIQDLTDEVMNQYGWEEAPATVRESVRDRLSRAEEKYHNGNRKGVSEIDVARAVNALAVKFQAPEYAKTSPSEVREIRGRLLPYLPDFIGRGPVQNGKTKVKKAHSAIEDMSPVEAAYVAMTVLHQKVYNPEFQLTQDERKAVWFDKHARTPRSAGNAYSQPTTGPTARQQEMEEVLGRAASTITQQDAASLPNKVLDTLGIER